MIRTGTTSVAAYDRAGEAGRAALIITCAAPGRGEHELACSPLAEYYREIGGAELSDLVRKWFDRVRWWQMPAGNPGGCSVDTYLLGLGRW